MNREGREGKLCRPPPSILHSSRKLLEIKAHRGSFKKIKNNKAMMNGLVPNSNCHHG